MHINNASKKLKPSKEQQICINTKYVFNYKVSIKQLLYSLLFLSHHYIFI